MAACPRIRRAICLEGEFDEWVAGEPEWSEEVSGSRDDVVTLFSSGGTTGPPKGMMMTNLAWETMIAGSERLVRTEHPIHLLAAPMTHAAGGSALVMMAMAATNVMLQGFDPGGVMSTIERRRVTHLFLPPTAIYRLLAHPEVCKYDCSSLRNFNYASAPMSPEKLKEAIDVFGPVMMTAFGQTETGVNVSFFSPEEHVAVLGSGDERRLLSCGRASLFSGGFNLFPSEIEKVVLAHPAVQDCAVIGVPDDDWGEAAKAAVQLKPEATFDPDGLREFCRCALASYKVPKSFEACPRNI